MGLAYYKKVIKLYAQSRVCRWFDIFIEKFLFKDFLLGISNCAQNDSIWHILLAVIPSNSDPNIYLMMSAKSFPHYLNEDMTSSPLAPPKQSKLKRKRISVGKNVFSAIAWTVSGLKLGALRLLEVRGNKYFYVCRGTLTSFTYILPVLSLH